MLTSWPLAIMALIVGPVAADTPSVSAGEPTAIAVFDEVWRLARDGFYDPSMAGLDWSALGARHRSAVEAEPRAWAREANAMLDALATSHTRVFVDDEPAYYQLLGVFADYLREAHPAFFRDRFGDGPVRYPGIGVFTALDGDDVVVTGVLEGLPAHAAGLRVGDVLLGVDDGPWAPIAPFRAALEVDRSAEVRVRRQAEADDRVITVAPAMLDAETMFVDAMRASATVVDHEGVRVGYVHAWSYSGRKYQALLESLVQLGGPLADADALVLDLRGGWGGASAEYLRLFARDIPALAMRPRGEDWRTFDTQWRKPVVGLIDGGTRSGKETLAWGFTRYGIGPLVGERTAGAVVAGRIHVLADGSLLYLAVADVRVDGERLEGRGVAPDIVIPFTKRYAAGHDPQRQRAIEEAASLVVRAAEGEPSG